MKKIVLVLTMAASFLAADLSAQTTSDYLLDYSDPTSFLNDGGTLSGNKFRVQGETAYLYLPEFQRTSMTVIPNYTFQVNLTGNLVAADYIEFQFSINGGTWFTDYTMDGTFPNNVQSFTRNIYNFNYTPPIDLTLTDVFRIRLEVHSTASNHTWEIRSGDVSADAVNPIDPPVLPIELIAFDGETVESGVDLNWQIGSASNFSHFVVEKMDENNNFVPFSLIKADQTIMGSASFSTTDNEPVAGENYYRLKMVDLDGSYEVSAPITVKYTNVLEDVTVFNNDGVISVDVLATSSTDYQVQIYNLTGHLLHSENGVLNEGANTIQIDNQVSLVTNVYLIKVVAGNSVFTRKFVY